MTDTRRITYVWLVLSAVTIVTWLLGYAEQEYGRDVTIGVAMVILAIAFGKVYLIVRHFMEVKSGPRWLRVFAGVWIVAVWGTIVGIYLW
jgi:cytochrome c oxidase subunit IV